MRVGTLAPVVQFIKMRKFQRLYATSYIFVFICVFICFYNGVEWPKGGVAGDPRESLTNVLISGSNRKVTRIDAISILTRIYANIRYR